MQLLIDIGNTRIKWCFASVERLHSSEAMSHSEWLALVEKKIWLEGVTETLSEETLSEVVIASVANESLVDKITLYAKTHWNCQTRRLLTTSRWQQLKNGYTDPAQMGVDRWMAMIAAWDNCRKACLVVDCGTAITLDAIAEDGQHLGGHIVAGMDLLQQVLIKQTAAVRPENKSSIRERGFADNTTDAVNQGSLCMLVDYLKNSWQRFQQQNPSAMLLITGGNGVLISKQIGQEDAFHKELVMQGIFLVAKKEDTKNHSGEDF